MATHRGSQGGILKRAARAALGLVLPLALGCAPARELSSPAALSESSTPVDAVEERGEGAAGAANSQRGTGEGELPDEPPKLVPLEIDGIHPAVVSVPQVGPFPKPLLVVAHGAGDRPDWHCKLWQELLGARGFILCLRGKRTSTLDDHDRAVYFLPNHGWLRRAMRAALLALEREHGDLVDTSGAAFLGYSQGGIMGSLAIQRLAGQFSRAALVEGGFSEWNVPVSKKFVQDGGQRILVVCGIAECQRRARTTVGYMRRGGAQAKLVYVEGGGHRYDGPIAEAVAAELEWFLGGDPRWTLAATDR